MTQYNLTEHKKIVANDHNPRNLSIPVDPALYKKVRIMAANYNLTIAALGRQIFENAVKEWENTK